MNLSNQLVEEDKGRARSFVEPNHSLKINCGNSKKYTKKGMDSGRKMVGIRSDEKR